MFSKFSRCDCSSVKARREDSCWNPLFMAPDMSSHSLCRCGNAILLCTINYMTRSASNPSTATPRVWQWVVVTICVQVIQWRFRRRICAQIHLSPLAR